MIIQLTFPCAVKQIGENQILIEAEPIRAELINHDAFNKTTNELDESEQEKLVCEFYESVGKAKLINKIKFTTKV